MDGIANVWRSVDDGSANMEGPQPTNLTTNSSLTEDRYQGQETQKERRAKGS